MKRLALALLNFILPLSAQKTFVEVPENMVRTEPILRRLPVQTRPFATLDIQVILKHRPGIGGPSLWLNDRPNLRGSLDLNKALPCKGPRATA